ncbi:hypothetical protein AUC69_14345 [Methyloceanibacter superfactus]|uniref:J domain-containing protein n=1 Tax=Methyloceanibacter superfactus TaxID=1774969 RepID=A0A1E3VU03_9HYPH|nr:J domain-containing protein [Methyloceanibacter superfactus]ODR96761.1 hypothetical protein AUC69_14345 [Methyloceanibacter superfactus]
MPQTYYEVLGVAKGAGAAEISNAYRQRAKELHPDLPGGDAEAFKRLNEAHHVLCDSYKRGLYDLQTKLQEPADEPASNAGVWVNILASLASGALGVMFWVWGDKPGDAYNGYFVALGWVAILYGIGLFVDRHNTFSNPLITAKRVIVYLLYAAIGLAISMSVLGAALAILAGLFALACWLFWLVF